MVLPEPCKPAIRMTVGGMLLYAILRVSPPSIATNSALTILMICWLGSSASETVTPIVCSRIRATTSRTTPTLTSASKSAVRISARTSSTSASVRRPLPRRRFAIPCNRSPNESNMKFLGYRCNTADKGRQPMTTAVTEPLVIVRLTRLV